MFSRMIFRIFNFCIFLTVMPFQPVVAGSGLYYGFDAAYNSLDTSTEVRLTFTPPPPGPSLQHDQRSQSFPDVGFQIGYLFKHRRTQNYFIAPEFFLTTLDSNDMIYGTSLKFGRDFGSMRGLVNLGVSRLDVFKTNKLHLGLGAEYAINDHQAISIEWLRIDTIDENTTANGINFTTDTRTERDIELIKISFRIYLLE